MFRDERFYRGIVFISQTLKSGLEVPQLLPKGSTTVAEKSRPLPNGILDHFYYYSETEFTRNIDLLAEAKKKRAGRTVFRYNLYALSVPLNGTQHILVAVPFSTMAKEVFLHMRNIMRGQRFQFARVLLDRAIAVSRDGKESAALLSVTRVKYNITADPFLETVTLVGENLAKSGTHNDFLKGADTGVTIEPEALRLSLDSQFTFATDNFGHFHFRVAKHASNLNHFPQMLRTLAELKLIEGTSAFPHMKHFEEDLENEA